MVEYTLGSDNIGSYVRKFGSTCARDCDKEAIFNIKNQNMVRGVQDSPYPAPLPRPGTSGLVTRYDGHEKDCVLRESPQN